MSKRRKHPVCFVCERPFAPGQHVTQVHTWDGSGVHLGMERAHEVCALAYAEAITASDPGPGDIARLRLVSADWS